MPLLLHRAREPQWSLPGGEIVEAHKNRSQSALHRTPERTQRLSNVATSAQLAERQTEYLGSAYLLDPNGLRGMRMNAERIDKWGDWRQSVSRARTFEEPARIGGLSGLARR